MEGAQITNEFRARFSPTISIKNCAYKHFDFKF